ncbi:MAG: glycine cleavage system aminomethyltransferase GcvT [Angustibacter sp.]
MAEPRIPADPPASASDQPDAGLAPRRSPLDDRHRAAEARFAEFGGWSMPLEYLGGGVVAEHTAVREQVGLFDVSHLGKVRVRGPGAVSFVNSCLTADLSRIEPGRAQYTLCCNESGGVVDDMIAYLRSDHELLLVPNAANTAEVAHQLAAVAPEGIAVTDEHTTYGVLAVQGPGAGEVVADLGLPAGHGYLSFVDATWRGAPVVVCRSGYTGELGYELLPTWQGTAALWDALVPAVEARGGRRAGLGARDTLRTEMGYPLHGQELSADITPVQARAGWAVGWGKPAFWGREALLAEKTAGPRRRLHGLRALDRGVPRAGLVVRDAAGEVGVTTSGTFSPTLKQGIALALLDARTAEGDVVVVDVRGRDLSCQVVRPPFVPARTGG